MHCDDAGRGDTNRQYINRKGINRCQLRFLPLKERKNKVRIDRPAEELDALPRGKTPLIRKAAEAVQKARESDRPDRKSVV